MDIAQTLAIRKARSMEVFADGDETFIWGDWRAWEAACYTEGMTIPPKEFKALPPEQRQAYLKRSNEG